MAKRTPTRQLARGLRKASRWLDDLGPKPSVEQQRLRAHEMVGGLWEEMGAVQLAFLQRRELEPSDSLLDIGCGCLRGGLHLIRYLDAERYCGVDRKQELLDIAQIELDVAGLNDKRPTLLCDSTFDFAAFEREFDVALAQSVFTHIDLNAVHRCLVRVSDVLRSGGVFYATILENKRDPHDLDTIEFPQPDAPPTVTYPDADPYCYHVSVFDKLIEGLPLKLEYIGEWGSLRGQSMLAFHRRG